MPLRQLILPVVIIFMLTAAYFGLSQNGINALHNHPVIEYTRNIWQAVFNPVDVKKLNSEKKITAQPVKPDSDEGNVAVTEKEAETGHSMLQDKVQAIEKNEMKETNKTASAMDTVAPVEPKVISLSPENKEQPFENKISKEMKGIVAEDSDTQERSANTGSRNGDKEESQGKNILNEMNQGAERDIQMIPFATFEKLVIPFPHNSNFPPVKSLEKLNIIADGLLTSPSYRIIVSGFTDSQGSRVYNKKLSEFRANSIKSYLVGRGVPEWRITAQGLGKQNYIAPNDTDAGRSANRRVEIEIIE
jgi:outer membrane protein OmpA-like peptidoglycan-associated protein